MTRPGLMLVAWLLLLPLVAPAAFAAGQYTRTEFAHRSISTLVSRARLEQMGAQASKREALTALKARVEREFREAAKVTLPAMRKKLEKTPGADPLGEAWVHSRLLNHRAARKVLEGALVEQPDDPRVISGDVCFDIAGGIAREAGDELAWETLQAYLQKRGQDPLFERRVKQWDRLRVMGLAWKRRWDTALQVDPADAGAIWELARFFRDHPIFHDPLQERIRLVQLIEEFKRAEPVEGGATRWHLAQNYERCFEFKEALRRYKEVQANHFKIEGVPGFSARLQEALERLKDA
ncbi:MAG: hypothetical protein HY719_08745 [Planctomycetes bacterium]|nr:hypothetical protein [Planctomycetota bacterium]